MFTYAMGEKGRRCMCVLYVCLCVHVVSSMHACLTQREETQLSLLIFCNLPSILIKKTHSQIYFHSKWLDAAKGVEERACWDTPKDKEEKTRDKVCFCFRFRYVFYVFFLFLGYVDITKSGILHTHNLSRWLITQHL